MKIRKIAHCCLIIETKTAEGTVRRIMTDPGYYSVEMHEKVNGLDMVLITHEHADHFHIESLKQMVKRIPGLSVITNDAVGDILAREGIEHHIMKDGNAIDHKGIHIEAFGEKHALMHSSIPAVSNVGFMVKCQGKTLAFPGDAFTDPKKPVDVLAIPVAGPWMKVSEAIDYGLALKPQIAFPVHDGTRIGMLHTFVGGILAKNGIEFLKLEEGEEIEA